MLEGANIKSEIFGFFFNHLLCAWRKEENNISYFILNFILPTLFTSRLFTHKAT